VTVRLTVGEAVIIGANVSVGALEASSKVKGASVGLRVAGTSVPSVGAYVTVRLADGEAVGEAVIVGANVSFGANVALASGASVACRFLA